MCPYYPALKVKRPYFHPIMRARLKSRIHQVISTHLTSNSFRLFSSSSLSTRSPSYFQFFPFFSSLSLSTNFPSYLKLFPFLHAPHLTYNSFRFFSFSSLFFPVLLFPFLPAPYLTSNSYRIFYSSSISTHSTSAILPPTLSVPSLFLSTHSPSYLQLFPFLFFSFPFYKLPILPPTFSFSFLLFLLAPHLTSNSFRIFFLLPFLHAPYLTSNSFCLFLFLFLSSRSPSYLQLFPFLFLHFLPAPPLTSNFFPSLFFFFPL